MIYCLRLLRSSTEVATDGSVDGTVVTHDQLGKKKQLPAFAAEVA